MPVDRPDPARAPFKRLGGRPGFRTISHSSEIQTRDGIWCTNIASEEDVIKIEDRIGEEVRQIKHHAIEIVNVHKGVECVKAFYPKGDEEVKVNIYQADGKKPSPVLSIVCGLDGSSPVTIVTSLGELHLNGSMFIY
jgi:aspartokinase-like uncharacterized kinase